MNNDVQAHEQLLLKHEVLRARFDIRDFFLRNTVREVYENIGQVLSLVRMQLAMLDAGKKGMIESKESPGNLVGQSIRDLRVMCKSFYPDTDIINEEGFVEALVDTVKILYPYPHNSPVIKVKGIQKKLNSDLKLIVFKMLQDLLTLIRETEGVLASLTIQYGMREVKYIILYKGKLLPLNKQVTDVRKDLSFEERAQLIRGKLTLTNKENDLLQIQLSHPLNYFYE